MPYTLELHLKKDTSRLTLFDNGQEVISREWPESRDTGRRLFEAIRGLLEETRLRLEDIADFRLESYLPETSTSMRIAQTVQRVSLFATKRKKVP